MKLEEKISLTCGKDGGLQNLEVHGILLLRVASENDGKIKVHIQNNDSRNIQLQVKWFIEKKNIFLLINILLVILRHIQMLIKNCIPKIQ